MTDPLLQYLVGPSRLSYGTKKQPSIVPGMSVDSLRINKGVIREMGTNLRPWQVLPCGLTASEFSYVTSPKAPSALLVIVTANRFCHLDLLGTCICLMF